MKITLHNIAKGEDEVVIHYRKMTPQIEDIVRAASGGEEKIPCTCDGVKCMVSVREILYAESVDRATFLYTRDGIYKTPYSLQQLEAAYIDRGFFRCAKSMLLCIYRVSSLRSETGGRIDATMENGEHVMISRKYAKALRGELKGD